MAGGEPRLGTTATYMRHNDHGTTRLSIEIDILHDRRDNEYRVFSAGSVRKWSKFGLVESPPPPDLPQQLQELLDRNTVGFLSTSSSSPPSVSENDDSCRLTLIRFLGSGNLCQLSPEPSARRASAQGFPQGG